MSLCSAIPANKKFVSISLFPSSFVIEKRYETTSLQLSLNNASGILIFIIPYLVFNFFKYYRRPRTPLIRPSVRPSVTKSTGGVKQPAGGSRRPKAGCFASRPGRLFCWSSSAKTKFGPTCQSTWGQIGRAHV